MTSSTRCSTRRAGLAFAVLVAAAAVAGCGHRAASVRRLGPAEPGARPRLLILPVDNLSGVAVPARELLAAMERTVRDRVDVVSAEELEEFLRRHRLRYTGGIDAESALAARHELGANAVLVTTVTEFGQANPPRLGIAARLVSATAEPEILWMDAFAWAGDQAPGLLGVGRVDRIGPVQDRVVGALGTSLRAFLAGKTRDVACGGRGYRPRVRYRSKALDDEEHRTIAVVPFLDYSKRRGAGDAIALEFVRQLVANGRYRVIEPGVVRGYLLSARVLIPGGISLETTRLMFGGLGADMVLSGMVLDFREGGRGAAAVRFQATLLDSRGEVLWSSNSYTRADDGVFMFGLGKVGNAQDLTCLMVTGVVDRLGRKGATAVAWQKREDVDGQSFVGEARDARAARRSGSAGR